MAKRKRYRAQGNVRYARVPRGAEPCDWCLMMAARGAVYLTDESARAAAPRHLTCKCDVVPVWGGALPEGYDPKRYKAMLDARKAARVTRGEDEHGIAAQIAEQTVVQNLDMNRDAMVYARLSEEQKDGIAAHIDGNETGSAAVYRKFESQFELGSIREPRAHYSPSRNLVNLDLGETEEGNMVSAPWQTWFHEFGHFIDSNVVPWYRMPRRADGTSVATVSELFKIGTVVRTEIEGLADKMMRDFFNLYDTVSASPTLEGVKEFCETLGVEWELWRKDATERLLAKGASWDDIEEGLMVGGKLKGANGVTTRDFWYGKIRQRVRDDLATGDVLMRWYSDFSDMFEAATGQGLGCGGHGRDYWAMAEENRHTEAFVEFMSAELSNPEAWAILQEYLPQSVEKYHEITAAILDGSIVRSL